jgi:hypothetical protein
MILKNILYFILFRLTCFECPSPLNLFYFVPFAIAKLIKWTPKDSNNQIVDSSTLFLAAPEYGAANFKKKEFTLLEHGRHK